MSDTSPDTGDDRDRASAGSGEKAETANYYYGPSDENLRVEAANLALKIRAGDPITTKGLVESATTIYKFLKGDAA